MADFTLSAFSVSIGAYNTAINLGPLGAELTLGAAAPLIVNDDDGSLDPGANPDTFVTFDGVAEGAVTDVAFRTFALDEVDSLFAVLSRDLAADVLLLPLDAQTGFALTEGLPSAGPYASTGVATLPSATLGFTDVGLALLGTEEGDALSGTERNDTISGLAGDDTIDADAGDDLISASDGNDSVEGGDGADTIGGGLGDDTVNGGADNDIIGMGRGDDSGSGGAGNDIVNGGAGDDSLSGDEGNDTMGAGFNDDLVLGGAGDDSLGGGTGRDDLAGSAGNDSIGGGEGNDTVRGGGGDDFLAGGGRDDVIRGGNGDDRINGGDGDDTMTGDDGADVFVFNFFKDGDADVITDFEDGIDSFFMRGVENAPGTGLAGKVAALGITDTDAGAQIDYLGHVVLIEGVAAADLTLADFEFL